jgi:hypothetical protein
MTALLSIIIGGAMLSPNPSVWVMAPLSLLSLWVIIIRDCTDRILLLLELFIFLGLGGVTPPALTSSALSLRSWLETGPPWLLWLDSELESQLPLWGRFLWCLFDFVFALTFSIATWLFSGVFKIFLLDSSLETMMFHECRRMNSFAKLCLIGELPVIIEFGCSTLDNLRSWSLLSFAILVLRLCPFLWFPELWLFLIFSLLKDLLNSGLRSDRCSIFSSWLGKYSTDSYFSFILTLFFFLVELKQKSQLIQDDDFSSFPFEDIGLLLLRSMGWLTGVVTSLSQVDFPLFTCDTPANCSSAIKSLRIFIFDISIVYYW